LDADYFPQDQKRQAWNKDRSTKRVRHRIETSRERQATNSVAAIGSKSLDRQTSARKQRTGKRSRSWKGGLHLQGKTIPHPTLSRALLNQGEHGVNAEKGGPAVIQGHYIIFSAQGGVDARRLAYRRRKRVLRTKQRRGPNLRVGVKLDGGTDGREPPKSSNRGRHE